MIYQLPTQRACTKDLPAHGLVSTVVPNVKSNSTEKKKRKNAKKTIKQPSFIKSSCVLLLTITAMNDG